MEKLNELVYRAERYLLTKSESQPEQINVSCKTIIAIAKAYRALEQRAEAAEAKLAGLKSLKAVGWQFEQCEGESCDNGAVVNVSGADVHLCAECSRDNKYSRMKVNALPKRLAHPAPAADLAELVPEQALNGQARFLGDKEPYYNRGWNDCRAAILSKIEQAK